MNEAVRKTFESARDLSKSVATELELKEKAKETVLKAQSAINSLNKKIEDGMSSEGVKQKKEEIESLSSDLLIILSSKLEDTSTKLYETAIALKKKINK